MISPAKGARRSKSGKEKKSKSEKKAASSPPCGSAEGESCVARTWLHIVAVGESVIECPSPSERAHRYIRSQHAVVEHDQMNISTTS
jgi:hypothetical protein